MPLTLRNKTIARRFKCTGTPHYCPPREDGLAACTRCGGLEGSLLKTCPLVRMTMDESDLAYHAYMIGPTCEAPSIADYNALVGPWNDAALDEYNERERRRRT